MNIDTATAAAATRTWGGFVYALPGIIAGGLYTAAAKTAEAGAAVLGTAVQWGGAVLGGTGNVLGSGLRMTGNLLSAYPQTTGFVVIAAAVVTAYTLCNRAPAPQAPASEAKV
jgi:hypothetical protein